MLAGYGHMEKKNYRKITSNYQNKNIGLNQKTIYKNIGYEELKNWSESNSSYHRLGKNLYSNWSCSFIKSGVLHMIGATWGVNLAGIACSTWMLLHAVYKKKNVSHHII